VEACQATLTAFSEESPAGPAPKCSGPSLDLQFQPRCLTIFSSCASFSLTFPHNVSTPPPETRPHDFLAFSLATALEAMPSLLPISGAVDNAFRRPRMKLLLRRTHSAYRVYLACSAGPLNPPTPIDLTLRFRLLNPGLASQDSPHSVYTFPIGYPPCRASRPGFPNGGRI
jgi:hypothetical protein